MCVVILAGCHNCGFLDESSFVFLFLLEVKCSDILKENIASIFGVTEI
jgi:hypothetical protein